MALLLNVNFVEFKDTIMTTVIQIHVRMEALALTVWEISAVHVFRRILGRIAQ